MLIVTYNQFDIVKVPFPFTDKLVTKNRPALIISSATAFNNQIEQSVMAMITSAKQSDWPLDTVITDIQAAGLPVPSLIRLKLFTLEHRLIRGTLGQLSNEDQLTFDSNMRGLLGIDTRTYTEDQQQFSYPTSQTPIKLKVLFEKNIAHHLAETPLSHDQKLTVFDENQVLLEATISETLELKWWLQGFGDNIEILEPTELRDKFKRVAVNLASIYSDS